MTQGPATRALPNDNVTVDVATAPQGVDNLVVNAGDGSDTIDGTTTAAGIFSSVTFNGEAGDDFLFGTQGVDTIDGGLDADTIVGNGGGDLQFGGDGFNTFIWNNGDGPDDNVGGFDLDVFEFNGADGADDVVMVAPGIGDGSLGTADFHLERTAPSAFFIEGEGIEDVIINGLAGADDITITPMIDTFFSVNGGDPAMVPGDVLTVDLTAVLDAELLIDTPANPGDGVVFFFSGEQPIDFTGIEGFDAIGGGFLVDPIVTGAGDNDINVSSDAGETVVTSDGTELLRIPTTAIAGSVGDRR